MPKNIHNSFKIISKYFFYFYIIKKHQNSINFNQINLKLTPKTITYNNLNKFNKYLPTTTTNPTIQKKNNQYTPYNITSNTTNTSSS